MIPPTGCGGCSAQCCFPLCSASRGAPVLWCCPTVTTSLHVVFSTMLEFLFLCDFAGIVAPDSFSGTVMTSFIGHKFDFYRFSGVLPVLPKF